MEQLPLVSCDAMHVDVVGVSFYIDCVRWVGRLLLSRGTDGRAAVWQLPHADALLAPPPSREEGSPDGAGRSLGITAELAAELAAELTAEKETAGSKRKRVGGAAGGAAAEVKAEGGALAAAPHPLALPTPSSEPRVLGEVRMPSSSDIWFLRFNLDPRCTLLALGNTLGETRLWSIDAVVEGAGNEAQPLAVLSMPTAPVGRQKKKLERTTVRHTALSHDCAYAVCGCDDGSVCVWELPEAARAASMI
jgi:WD40 repeat protein